MRRFINSPRREPQTSRRDEDDQRRPDSDARHEEEEDDRDNPDDEDGRGDSHERGSHERRHRTNPARFSGAQAVKYAQQYISDLTGQIPESVSGLTRSDGGWKVALDVVELERVPRTTDVLASYEVELDENGDLVGYRRLSRYYRSQVDER